MRFDRSILVTVIAIAGLALLALAGMVPGAQGQGSLGPTATPDAEGVIYATVQEGDSFWTIAARHGLTLAEIYELNDAEEGDFVQVGQRLIVGYSQEGTPEVEATVAITGTEDEAGDGGQAPGAAPTAETTATPPATTATTPPRGGEICLSAYLDENRNGQRDPGEQLKSAVAFTIADGEAVVSNYVTDGVSEPYCITGLDNSNYRITRSTAQGEVLTTPGEWAVSLAGESSQTVEFGSYFEEEAAPAAEADTETLNSAAEGAADAGEEGGFTRIIVIAAVVVSVLLLVGVLVIVLSVRRSTV